MKICKLFSENSYILSCQPPWQNWLYFCHFLSKSVKQNKRAIIPSLTVEKVKSARKPLFKA